MKKLGWKDVPVRVIAGLDDAVAALKAEMEENTCRVDLTPTEIVELGRQIESLEKPKAKERQASTGTAPGKPKNASPNLGEALPKAKKKAGEVAARVAEAVGVSPETYRKAKQVVQAAEQEPEKFGDLPAAMDKAGKVEPAFREMKERAKATQIVPDPPAKVPPRASPQKPAREHLEKAVGLLTSEADCAAAIALIRQAIELLSRSESEGL